MKILSWNVNGLNACINKGFCEKMRELKPDVICIQETKLSEDLKLDLPYNTYWNHSGRSGYSGTAILSKYNPISVLYGMASNLDDEEGRVLTLEYKHFFLVNVYIPNSQASLRRYDYRDQFDKEFYEYIARIQTVKPVIICGDFNVAASEFDIYPENEINEKLSHGFMTQERNNFFNLLDLGFDDVFRFYNSEKIEYSWWSNRLNKRFENKGWRIDYFLSSASITKYITNFSHMTYVLGSDHCPLILDINQSSMGIDKITDDELAARWNAIDWIAAEDALLDMQQKLTKATFSEDASRIIEMQKRIVRAECSKVLAVRHVTETSSGPGIDGVKWITPCDKMRAALSLTSKDYKAQPYRHIVIQSKYKNKERRISVPTMYDRAMQVLYAYSLDPVAEATAERKSFAFRKGRSMQDVHAYLMDCLSGTKAPRYVLIADVKSCYNMISHHWLLEHIPMDKLVLKEFLKAGFVFAGSIFPIDQGISLGSNISPILGNMTLDGMQKYIYDTFYGRNPPDYANGNLIRFADDILVTAYTREDAEQFKQIIEDFLEPRGLRLSEAKTHIYDVREGFDFISRNYSNKNGVLYACPSTSAIERFEANLKETIMTHKGSQQSLIELLNKKLTGFATFHRITEAHTAFAHIDVTVNALLLEACIQKHPKQTKAKLIEKYWYKRRDGQHVYAVKDKIECQVLRLSDVLHITHRKIKTNANPYLELEYFENREKEKAIFNIVGKYKAIWTRQKGRCFYCGNPILFDQHRTVVPINIALPPHTNNLAYIHLGCREDELIFRTTSESDEVLNSHDVMSLLVRLNEDTKPSENKPFERLREYFFNLELSPHTLYFKDIERIMENTLCASAYKHRGYWYNTNSGSITECWLNNGYVIQHLHIDKGCVVFRKENTNISKLKIPSVFLTQKIPNDAKYEIENYLEFIKRKYGL